MSLFTLLFFFYYYYPTFYIYILMRARMCAHTCAQVKSSKKGRKGRIVGVTF